MGYAIYENNGRWQGYGIPAYCDYPGCKEEIDRGMGYQHHEDKENSRPNVFCCSDHQYEKIDSFEVDYNREHPDWLKHILTNGSWDQWRKENPGDVEKYKKILDKIK